MILEHLNTVTEEDWIELKEAARVRIVQAAAAFTALGNEQARAIGRLRAR